MPMAPTATESPLPGDDYDFGFDNDLDGDDIDDSMLMRAMDSFEAGLSSSSLSSSAAMVASANAAMRQTASQSRQNAMHQPSLHHFMPGIASQSKTRPTSALGTRSNAPSPPVNHLTSSHAPRQQQQYQQPPAAQDQPLASIGLAEESPDGPSRQAPEIDPQTLLQYATSHHAFDSKTVTSWLYPTNYPVRDYQFNITQRALFLNTLVSLPTGLGKTLIAAVVMFNFYRWFPEGKIIFMAPTRPLVTQQIEACYKIVGIPSSDTAMFIGTTMSPTDRETYWKTKRVFFATPQTVQNDIQRGVCPIKQIVCLVMDEAHRATGSYAYSVVVREVLQIHPHFRILALSATPGNNKKKVEEVIDSLKIARIEVRTEDSVDLVRYTHRKHTETVVVRLDGVFAKTRESLRAIMQPIVDQLKRFNVITTSDLENLSVFVLNECRARFNKYSDNPRVKTSVNAQITTLQKFARLYETLTQQSLLEFLSLLKALPADIANEQIKHPPQQLLQIVRGKQFVDLVAELDALVATIGQPSPASALPYAHPKQAQLERILLEHFTAAEEEQRNQPGPIDYEAQTKVMVFAQYRYIVEELRVLLAKHEPLIRAMPFIGQGQAKKTGAGMNQREQIQVVKKFKQGNYNTLIATSIGEEGLDIGEVDMILCYDSTSSPIQMLQRVGRTGRKRDGKVFILLTAGKEQEKYRRSQDGYKALQSSIRHQDRQFALYRKSTRVLPWVPHAKPVCIKLRFHVPDLTDEALAMLGAHVKPVRAAGGSSSAGAGNYKRGPFLDNEDMIKYMSTCQLSASDLAELQSLSQHPARVDSKSLQGDLAHAPPPPLGHWPITLSLTQHLNWQTSNFGLYLKTGAIGRSRRTEQLLDILSNTQSLKERELDSSLDYRSRTRHGSVIDDESYVMPHVAKRRLSTAAKALQATSTVHKELPAPPEEPEDDRQSAIAVSETSMSEDFGFNDIGDDEDDDDDDLPELWQGMPSVSMNISALRQRDQTPPVRSGSHTPPFTGEASRQPPPDAALLSSRLPHEPPPSLNWPSLPTGEDLAALVDHGDVAQLPRHISSGSRPVRLSSGSNASSVSRISESSCDTLWDENPVPFALPWEIDAGDARPRRKVLDVGLFLEPRIVRRPNAQPVSAQAALTTPLLPLLLGVSPIVPSRANAGIDNLRPPSRLDVTKVDAYSPTQPEPVVSSPLPQAARLAPAVQPLECTPDAFLQRSPPDILTTADIAASPLASKSAQYSQPCPAVQSPLTQFAFCVPAKRPAQTRRRVLDESPAAPPASAETFIPDLASQRQSGPGEQDQRKKKRRERLEQQQRALVSDMFFDVEADVSGSEDERHGSDDEQPGDTQGSLVEFIDEREHHQITQYASDSEATCGINVYRQVLQSPDGTPAFLQRGRRLLAAAASPAQPLPWSRAHARFASDDQDSQFAGLTQSNRYDSDDSFLADDDDEVLQREIDQGTQSLEVADRLIEAEEAEEQVGRRRKHKKRRRDPPPKLDPPNYSARQTKRRLLAKRDRPSVTLDPSL
ncbi:3'-5' DNA helicase [Sorochytrium milnesiophthora]